MHESHSMKYINWEKMYQGKLKMKEIHNKMSPTMQMSGLKENILAYLISYHQKKVTSMAMNF